MENIKILERRFEQDMIVKDFEAFKRTHPTLLKCILKAMDEVSPPPHVSGSLLLQAKELFAKLTDDERMEVMGDYCKHCGCNDSGCQCWNDD